MTGYVLACDIGGTFTDLVLAGPSGHPWATKRLTTPQDPTEGLLAGVKEILALADVAADDVVRVVHGTTLATNTILERDGAPVAFITTRGFGSMLGLGRQGRVEEERYDLFFDPAEPPVPLDHTFEITERTSASGDVVIALDEAGARAVAARVAELGVAGVAICLINSYANPAHEQRVAEICRDVLPPSVLVIRSSEVWPEWREYERATTTVISAYVAPVMSRYLLRLEDGLHQLGIHAPLHVMESSGGVLSAALAAQRAVYTVESGPAAGVVAVQQVGRRLGIDDLISFDMGGTTAKAALIRGGEPEITHAFQVGGKGSYGSRRVGSGIPIKVPTIDLAEVGAGGGSIAWVDPGGALRVGPKSAGAAPGPACYGRGGQHATVTDADLLLGYLSPGSMSAGGLTLDRRAAEQAMGRLAEQLGTDVTAAAAAVIDIANANMANAVHVVTVQRGCDPRDFALVALGGAAPSHVARIANEFGIDTVLVPPQAGVGSAVGLLTTDLRTERARTVVMAAGSADPAVVTEVLAALTAAALSDLGGVAQTEAQTFVDVRYRGQGHELTVPLPAGPLTDADLEAVIESFYLRYLDTYGIDLRDPAELVTFRVRVSVPVESRGENIPPEGQLLDTRPVAASRRSVYIAEQGAFVDTPVYERSALAPESAVSGPALIEDVDSTLLVPPGWQARADRWSILHLRRG
jgi:N-methylhydantoinase A